MQILNNKQLKLFCCGLQQCHYVRLRIKRLAKSYKFLFFYNLLMYNKNCADLREKNTQSCVLLLIGKESTNGKYLHHFADVNQSEIDGAFLKFKHRYTIITLDCKVHLARDGHASFGKTLGDFNCGVGGRCWCSHNTNTGLNTTFEITLVLRLTSKIMTYFR